jgi:hypothetical protein
MIIYHISSSSSSSSSSRIEKVKLSLCLINYAQCHEDILGSGGITPPFLTSALVGKEWSASRLVALVPRGKSPSPRCPLDRGLGGPQSRSGRCSEQKNFLSLSEIEPIGIVGVAIEAVWIVASQDPLQPVRVC